MTNYKLVPVEPTPEMVEAAADAYMPFGDMDLALRMAILAAPVVQGEPVAFCEDAALSIAERTFSTEVDEQLASDIIQYAQRLHSLYTAPQPAEQQPELCRSQPCGCVVCICEHETKCMGCGAKHCGTHPAGQIPVPVYQQPAQDVAGLVEALDDIANLPIDPCSTKNDYRLSAAKAIANATLAAYREGVEK